MYEIEKGILHGSSYAVPLDTVEFITWRLNEESGEYWVKFHVPSGKEIRIKVSREELIDIVDDWSNDEINLELV